LVPDAVGPSWWYVKLIGSAELIAEVAYELLMGRIRHLSFQGFRENESLKEVVREAAKRFNAESTREY